jgi:hypothetical protein
VPLLLLDGCCEGELHIATAAIPVLVRVTGDEEMAFILAMAGHWSPCAWSGKEPAIWRCRKALMPGGIMPALAGD